MTAEHGWECYTEAGRQPSGIRVQDWVTTAENHGAGEFLLTNVDRDGTRKGLDLSLLARVRDAVSVPVVASSGAGGVAHVVEALSGTGADGIALGAGLHWGNFTVSECREGCRDAGVLVRQLESVDD